MKNLQKLPKFGAKESVPNPSKEQDALSKLQEFLSRPQRKASKVLGKYLQNITEIPTDNSLSHIYGTRKSSSLYLFPEETCYLLDKQDLQIGLNSAEVLCNSDITINDYVLYSDLKRRGYVVRRRNELDHIQRYLDILHGNPIKKSHNIVIFDCFTKESFSKKHPGSPVLSITSRSLDSPVLLEDISIGVVENGIVISLLTTVELIPEVFNNV